MGTGKGTPLGTDSGRPISVPWDASRAHAHAPPSHTHTHSHRDTERSLASATLHFGAFYVVSSDSHNV